MKKNFKTIMLLAFMVTGANELFAQSQTALNFDGINDHVQIGNNLGFEYTDEFTVEAWVKTNVNGGYQIISKLDASYKGWGLQMVDGHLSAYVSSIWGSNFSWVNAAPPISGGTLINDGVWHHVAMVYDGATNITLYVDGNIELPINSGNNLSASILNSGSTEIGCYDANGSPGEFWVGEIENLSIFSTQRSQAEIQSDMYKCFDGSEINLLAHYNFNDGTGNSTLSDLSSNNYDGTLINMDPITDWVPGFNNLDLTTTTSGITISANNVGATYQWLNCDNGYAIISGENGQSYTAILNGNYAIELTENGCVDTTACVAITTVGIIENSFGDVLSVYPNPTNGNFSIDLGAQYESLVVSISDISGTLIYSKTMSQSQVLNLDIQEPAGIYIVSIQTGEKKAIIRLVKQ